jgi:hypothetical protein
MAITINTDANIGEMLQKNRNFWIINHEMHERSRKSPAVPEGWRAGVKKTGKRAPTFSLSPFGLCGFEVVDHFFDVFECVVVAAVFVSKSRALILMSSCSAVILWPFICRNRCVFSIFSCGACAGCVQTGGTMCRSRDGGPSTHSYGAVAGRAVNASLRVNGAGGAVFVLSQMP